MASKRLTDISTTTGVTLSDFIHIVNPNDQSQDVAGSSYRVTIQQVYDAFNIPSGSTDNYVTGGTYSNGTLILERQNGSVTINGFYTGDTFVFTGNTSATCITDLYVDNLYGCSPITARDLIQYSFETGWTQNQTVSYISASTGNVLVTKEWVESLSFDDSTALAVNVATTGSLPACTYYNGIANDGVGATLTRNTNGTLGTIDGITTFGVGDRILVKNQSIALLSGRTNGVYEVTVVGNGSTPFVLTRATDSDETSEFDPQVVIPSFGSQAGLRFAQLTADPVVGTNNISYASVGNNTSFVTQNPSGTQTLGNVPFWENTARMLNKGSSQLFWDKNTNRLGIGTGTPQEKLDVNGKTRTTTLQVTSGATTGYVLKALDNNGNASWQPDGGITTDTYVTGFTFDANTYDLTIFQNNGVTPLTQNLSVLASDITITGGTYNPNNGEATFYNNSGGSFTVTGFLTGYTDVQVSGLTYNGNVLVLTQTDNTTFSATTPTFNGGVVNGLTIFTGGLSATTFSATTIGASGNCVTDIFVSNLHSCSPLNINPNNEGDVNFGSSSSGNTLSLDVTNKKSNFRGNVVMSGLTNFGPDKVLDVYGADGVERMYWQTENNNQNSGLVLESKLRPSLLFRSNNVDAISYGINNINIATGGGGFLEFKGATNFPILRVVDNGEVYKLNANVNNEYSFYFDNLPKFAVGKNFNTPTASVHIKGEDDTSSNYGLKVESSGGTNNLSVRNDGQLFLGYEAGLTQTTQLGNNYFGYQAGRLNTGTYNTLIGYRSAYNSALGTGNVFLGSSTGAGNGSADYNIGIGYNVLANNVSGSNNIGIGQYALGAGILSGGSNIAIGYYSMAYATTAAVNIGIGNNSLLNLTTGNFNTGVGHGSLYGNSTGVENTAVGLNSLYGNSIGIQNTAVGAGALSSNQSSYNTALGIGAGGGITIGTDNIAIGRNALNNSGSPVISGSSNIAIGYRTIAANTSGNYNTVIGNDALIQNTTGNGSVALGAFAGYSNNGSNSVFIGAEAGYRQTNATNRLFIDNRDRQSVANEENNSLIVGTFNATPTNQLLRFNSKVGVYTSPTVELEVSGKTSTTTLQVTSSATTGYVLTSSDNNGNATWLPVSGITGVVNKYTTSSTFSNNETKTITHNLGTKYIHCSVWDVTTDELITAQVVRTSGNNTNAVDITIATAGTYDILITG